jgi:ferredoxin
LGLQGLLQPHLDFEKNFCNFNCTRCMDVCPTGALVPAPLGEKRLMRLGRAEFVKSLCIVETKGTDCGACAEHCPTHAVIMVPFRGKLMIPEVTADHCIGCGACEYACPVRPARAIVVHGLTNHELALPPKEIKSAMPAAHSGDDFPF